MINNIKQQSIAVFKYVLYTKLRGGKDVWKVEGMENLFRDLYITAIDSNLFKQ